MLTLSGSDEVSPDDQMATVVFAGLGCDITYTIIAGGRLDGNLVGPKSSHGTAMGDCPVMVTPTTASATMSMAGKGTINMMTKAFCIFLKLVHTYTIWHENFKFCTKILNFTVLRLVIPP